MEEGINAFILEQFDLKNQDIRTFSPLTLAFIGDAIYDLVIRSFMVGQGNTRVSQLHKKTSQLVRASCQSTMVKALLPDLTIEEMTVYKRGRNANSSTKAKHASVSEYRLATGFEALLGYLYVKDDFNRIMELVKIGLQRINELDSERIPIWKKN
jgi:ribonuclease-3 family protein